MTAYQSDYKRGYRGLLHLYFHDEAPRIGCGWRKVEVTVGTNKVRVRCPYTKRTAKIRRPEFDTLAKASRMILSVPNHRDRPNG